MTLTSVKSPMTTGTEYHLVVLLLDTVKSHYLCWRVTKHTDAITYYTAGVFIDDKAVRTRVS